MLRFVPGVSAGLLRVDATGPSVVSGSLIFGIGSQANNAPGSATVLRANADRGM